MSLNHFLNRLFPWLIAKRPSREDVRRFMDEEKIGRPNVKDPNGIYREMNDSEFSAYIKQKFNIP